MLFGFLYSLFQIRFRASWMFTVKTFFFITISISKYLFKFSVFFQYVRFTCFSSMSMNFIKKSIFGASETRNTNFAILRVFPSFCVFSLVPKPMSPWNVYLSFLLIFVLLLFSFKKNCWLNRQLLNNVFIVIWLNWRVPNIKYVLMSIYLFGILVRECVYVALTLGMLSKLFPFFLFSSFSAPTSSSSLFSLCSVLLCYAMFIQQNHVIFSHNLRVAISFLGFSGMPCICSALNMQIK